MRRRGSLHLVSFVPRKLSKGPVDQKKEYSSRELKEPIQLKGKRRMIFKWILDLRVEWVCTI
jgi:hypothetical protein